MTLRTMRATVLAAALVVVPAAILSGMLAPEAKGNEPASTAFSYQGQLTQNGLPANGAFEFEFRFFDAPAGGNMVASVPGPHAADVTNGLFTARLDPGPATFTGVQLWLEIAVRPESDLPVPYVILNPRHEVTANPYAAVALNSPFRRDGSGLYYEGRLALGSDVPPSGILNVAGPPQDATVVLPGNAISSVETLDEPGTAGAFDSGTFALTEEGVTLASATIQCPGPGYVLAMGTTSMRASGQGGNGANLGIEDTALPSAEPPADASRFYVNCAVGTGVYVQTPASVQKVFTVSSGQKTFHLRGWRIFDSVGVEAWKGSLHLVFIPTAYGSLPQVTP